MQESRIRRRIAAPSSWVGRVPWRSRRGLAQPGFRDRQTTVTKQDECPEENREPQGGEPCHEGRGYGVRLLGAPGEEERDQGGLCASQPTGGEYQGAAQRREGAHEG